MSAAFCFLTNNFPDYVKIKEETITVDTRTSTAIACWFILEKKDIPLANKVNYLALRLFNKSYNSVCKILKCESVQLDSAIMKYLEGPKELKPEAVKKRGEKTFDFLQDSGAICASFRQMYGLSVKEVQSLHWWEFLMLFENLSGDNSFNNIRNIRQMKPEKNDSAERKESIRLAKKAVQLVDTRSEEEKREDFNNALSAIL